MMGEMRELEEGEGRVKQGPAGVSSFRVRPSPSPAPSVQEKMKENTKKVSFLSVRKSKVGKGAGVT